MASRTSEVYVYVHFLNAFYDRNTINSTYFSSHEVQGSTSLYIPHNDMATNHNRKGRGSYVVPMWSFCTHSEPHLLLRGSSLILLLMDTSSFEVIWGLLLAVYTQFGYISLRLWPARRLAGGLSLGSETSLWPPGPSPPMIKPRHAALCVMTHCKSAAAVKTEAGVKARPAISFLISQLPVPRCPLSPSLPCFIFQRQSSFSASSSFFAV